MPDQLWDAVPADPRSAAKPARRIQQCLSEIPRHMLRVECMRCFRIVEIQKADAVQCYGRHARSTDVGQRRLDQTCSPGTERHEEDGCWTEQSAIDVVQVALLDNVVASPLAAKLGGAPSVRHETARGHAGWTAWVAVVRIHKTRSARRYGSLQVMGPDARPMTNRLCRRKRTGERERRGQCDCREFHVFSVVVCKTTDGAFVRAEKVSRRRLPTNKSCSTGTIVHDGCSG
jgi:hypothetical protein